MLFQFMIGDLEVVFRVLFGRGEGVGVLLHAYKSSLSSPLFLTSTRLSTTAVCIVVHRDVHDVKVVARQLMVGLDMLYVAAKLCQ